MRSSYDGLTHSLAGVFESVHLRLFEDGKQLTNEGGEASRLYSIRMTDGAGNTHQLRGEMYLEQREINICYTEGVETVIRALRQGGSLRFVLVSEANSAERYEFTVDSADGYDAAYDAWYIK